MTNDRILHGGGASETEEIRVRLCAEGEITMHEKIEKRKGRPVAEMSRRNALAKLGLTLVAVYAAPVVLNLNKAAAGSSGTGGGSSSGTGWDGSSVFEAASSSEV